MKHFSNCLHFWNRSICLYIIELFPYSGYKSFIRYMIWKQFSLCVLFSPSIFCHLKSKFVIVWNFICLFFFWYLCSDQRNYHLQDGFLPLLITTAFSSPSSWDRPSFGPAWPWTWSTVKDDFDLLVFLPPPTEWWHCTCQAFMVLGSTLAFVHSRQELFHLSCNSLTDSWLRCVWLWR